MEKMSKTDEYALVAKYLGNISYLTYFAQKQDVAFLKRAAENLAKVAKEREETEEMERLEAEDLEQKRLAMIESLKEQGWSIEQLTTPIRAGNLKKRPRVVPAKYEFPTKEGKRQKWSGVGKMPNALKSLIEQGRKLEEFSI